MSRRHGAMFADKSRTRDSWQLLKILMSYLVGYKKAIGVVAGVILIYTVLATYQPVIIQQALDLLIEDPSSDVLTPLVIIFIVVSVLVWIFESLNTWLMADISTGLVNEIRQMAFKNLIHADMAYHHQNQSGNVTSRVVNDTNEIATGLNVFTQASTQLLLIVATFGILLYIDWRFALISLIAVPVAIFLSKIVGTIGRRRMLQTRQAYGEVSGKLAENLAGVSIAKSFNQEERISEEIRTLNQKTYEYMKSLLSVFILIFPSISMVSTLLVFGVLLTGGWLYSSGSITIGNIFLATVMVQRFLRPVINLSNNYTQLQASFAALDRVTDILEAQPAIQDSAEAVPLEIDGGEITFENVWFAYEADNYVLQDINIEVKAGTKLALVGHTGAGKTTVTSLLMRFYDPAKGSILIDGQDIRDITLASLNDTISLVSQEPYLFAETVLENIRYGKPEANDTDIYDICQLIGADEFIDALPDGYMTRLDEGGKNLSAGQRQMITIARTMLSDPEILVLDEATSRLDAYSESLVQNAQRLLFEGRTTLIIAHRLSTIRDVDYLVVLEEGKILEKGTHNELIDRQGKYAELYNTYYAHQGTAQIEVSILDEDCSLLNSKHTETQVHIQSTFQTRKHRYGDQLHIVLKIPENDETYLPGDHLEFEQMLDGIIQLLQKMSQMHQINPNLEMSLIHDNGYIDIEISHKELTIPEKYIAKMVDQDGNSPSTHSSASNLAELVSKIGGTFNIISPIPDQEKGVIFRARFDQSN